jgi:2-oxoglutarate dehydrogenase E2 component (dihydrolipoamide succinyltransferase)
MATEVTMPQLGESVVEGTIGKWLKQPGEHVEQYEPLLEVVTDKVDTEVPAPVAGVVREIKAEEGATVRVGEVLAILDGATDELPASNSAPPTVPHPQREAGSPPVSPVVARMVTEHNLDITKIEGTGLNSRVTKQDVLRYLEQKEGRKQKAEAITQPEPAPAVAMAPPQPTTVPSSIRHQALSDTDDTETLPLTAMRRAIAEHMVFSRRTAPHVTSVFEVDVTHVVAHRAQHQAEFERQGVKLTFTPYFVQAAVAALRAVPRVNASYAEEGIVQHKRIHMGVAVALPDGLIVPVIRNVDEKSLVGLAQAVNDLAERARTRRLTPDETQGGTFTITNHGVSGSLFATPIINQPQAAILGVGAIQKRPVIVTQDGMDAIAIRSMCYLSLTIDHRLLDGAVADQFLSVMKAFLENYR